MVFNAGVSGYPVQDDNTWWCFSECVQLNMFHMLAIQKQLKENQLCFCPLASEFDEMIRIRREVDKRIGEISETVQVQTHIQLFLS